MNKSRYFKEVICILACICLNKITGSSLKSSANSNCQFQKVDNLLTLLGKEIFYKPVKGFKCNIKRADFTFDLNKNDHLIKNKMLASINQNKITIEFNWSKKLKQSSLTRHFDMFALLDYFTDFNYYIYLKFVNLHGFELSLFDRSFDSSIIANNSLQNIFLINSDLTFFINGKPVKNCSDFTLLQLNKSSIISLFQIPMVVLEDEDSNEIIFLDVVLSRSYVH